MEEEKKDDTYMCLEFTEQDRTHQIAFGTYKGSSSAALFVEGSKDPVFLPLPLLDELTHVLRRGDPEIIETHRVVCTECETYYRLLNNGWTSIECKECGAEIENPDLHTTKKPEDLRAFIKMAKWQWMAQ